MELRCLVLVLRTLTCLVVLLAQPAFAAPKRCELDPVMTTKPAPPPPAACHKPPAAIATAVRAEIVKRYHPTWDGGAAVVDFPCDGLGSNIREIVIEEGDGHGGSLGMWRATRGTGGYDVRGIAFQGGALGYQKKSPPYELVTGRVSLAGLDAVRASLAAKVTETQQPPNGSFGISGSFSSHDFYTRVRLVDDDGRVLERVYAGYEGSQDQNEFLGIMLAGEALSPITSLPSSVLAPTAADRTLFAERFVAAVDRFDAPFYWWVMERYVELARYLGTRAVIPGLLTRLAVSGKLDRSKRDARESAVEALATITGWDARSAGGSIEAAAAAYLRECK